MSTEILSPVSQPSLLYPALYGIVRPRKKDYTCPKCNSDNRTELAAIESSGFRFSCQWCGTAWGKTPELLVNEILSDQLERISNFTRETKREFGALIMRNSKGIVLDFIQIGENTSIELTPTRELQDGEEILGTFHAHPITDQPSCWDLGTYLRDAFEKVSIVAGSKGHMTVMVKTEETVSITNDQLREWEKACQKENGDLRKIGETHKFLVYRGLPSELKLISGEENTATLEALLKNVRGLQNI